MDTGTVTCIISTLVFTDDICNILSDTLISRGNQLLTGSVGKNVRIWSVVGVGEMRLPGDHGNMRSGGLTMEDEMNLDGAITAAAFDEAMDMVNYCSSKMIGHTYNFFMLFLQRRQL